IVYVASYNGVPSLYMHDIDRFASTLIPGTGGADHPAISPDGAWVAFVADRKIKKVAFAGGEPLVLCESPVGLGLGWGVDGNLFFNPGIASAIVSVPASGGATVAATKLRGTEVEHRFPELLSDGVTLLYSALGGGSAGAGGEQIFAESLRTAQRTLV